MPVRQYMEKLKQRWSVSSNLDFALIMLSFALAGASIIPVKRFLFQLLQIGPDTAFFIKGSAWLFLVLPAYQLLLLVYGSLFGQFAFFREKLKKMARWMLRLKNIFI